MKSPGIAERVGIDPGPSNVLIRSYITEVIKKHGLPVAGNPSKGYYLIDNEEELRTYIRSLQGRIGKITDRIAWVLLNYNKYYSDRDLILTNEIFGFELDEDDD